MNFVFTLRTGVETRYVISYAVLNTLVVAGLEMQTIEFSFATPVAPIECSAGTKIERAGYGLCAEVGQNHDDLLAHAGGGA